VGISDDFPAARLSIGGNIKIADGTQASGKVLTSDTAGLASWQALTPNPWTILNNNAYNTNSGSIGIGISSPAASAQLDITSTSKGVLVPRVTTAQMNAIASPATGLLVYNTAASAFAYRTASGWVFLTGNTIAGAGWSTLGNSGTNPASNFIGTTDNQPMVVRQNNQRAGLLAGLNTSWGVLALNTENTGTFNSAFGGGALGSNTTGLSNPAIGTSALLNNTQGNSNTAFGASAGNNNQTGSGNVFIGNQAGVNETGSNKLYISNNFANALLYGEFDTERLRIQNKLGIGRLPNTFPLEIQALAGTDDLLQFFNSAGTARWHLNLLPNGSLNFTESPAATNRLVLGIGGEVGVGKVPLTGNNDSRLVVKQKGLQNGVGIESSNSSNHWDFYVTGGTSSDLQLYYNGALKGTYGNAGGVYTPSDKRLKKDIATYQPILNKLQQLEAFHYHYLDNKSTDPLSTGFMAQDVQKIFPDAVNETEMKNGEKMLGINYQYFTVVAIKGLQEQQKEIADMKLQLKLMMEEIEKLKKK